jgi:hypothetical protein
MFTIRTAVIAPLPLNSSRVIHPDAAPTTASSAATNASAIMATLPTTAPSGSPRCIRTATTRASSCSSGKNSPGPSAKTLTHSTENAE